MGSTVTIDLSNSSTWPVRMLRTEVGAVLRISQRELYRRIQQGRFPKPDDGRTWSRDFVERYVKGGVKDFERGAEKVVRRQSMSVVGVAR